MGDAAFQFVFAVIAAVLAFATVIGLLVVMARAGVDIAIPINPRKEPLLAVATGLSAVLLVAPIYYLAVIAVAGLARRFVATSTLRRAFIAALGAKFVATFHGRMFDRLFPPTDGPV